MPYNILIKYSIYPSDKLSKEIRFKLELNFIIMFNVAYM